MLTAGYAAAVAAAIAGAPASAKAQITTSIQAELQKSFAGAEAGATHILTSCRASAPRVSTARRDPTRKTDRKAAAVSDEPGAAAQPRPP